MRCSAGSIRSLLILLDLPALTMSLASWELPAGTSLTHTFLHRQGMQYCKVPVHYG